MTEHKAGVAKRVTMEIAGMRQQQIRIAETFRTENELLEKKVKEMRESILKGEVTSGDRITDFFIGAYGVIDDTEVSRPLRDLEGKLTGKNGQFFIVVRREKEEYGPVFRGGPFDLRGFGSKFHIKSRYFLGILADDKLLLDPKEKSFSLPTEAYVELMLPESEKTPGPFRFDSELLRLPLMPETLEEVILATYDSARALEVIAGCDAVLAYSPPELHAKPGTRPASWVISLNRAIRLLGRLYPEAPEEVAEREGKLYMP